MRPYLLGCSQFVAASINSVRCFGQGAGMNEIQCKTDTINDLDYPTGQRGSKAFQTLAARFALAGYQLTRTDPADGPVNYHAAWYGLSHRLPTLCHAQRLALQLEATP